MLGPGETYDGTLTITLPDESGSYWVLVEPDSNDNIEEGADDGDVQSSLDAIQLTLADRPNLTPMAIAVDDPIIAGTTIEIGWEDHNTGAAALDGTYIDRIHLSEDAELDPLDVSLGFFVYSDPIEAGGFAARTESVVVPITSEGARFIIVEVDAADGIEEEDELDNELPTSSTRTIVQPDLPDLRVQPFAPPTSGMTLETIAVDWITENVGELAATGPWTDRVLFSPNDELDGDEFVAGLVAADGTIDPGGTLPVSGAIELPSQPGDYWVIVRTNDDNAVPEGADVENNVTISSAPITVTLAPRPDLVARNVSTPEIANPGSTTPLTWSVRNEGNLSVAGTWTERVLASPDDVLGDANDLVVGNFVFETDIAVGGQVDRVEEIVVPNLPQGYYVFVVVDVNESVAELEEQNNSWRSEALAYIGLPDLRPTLTTVPSSCPRRRRHHSDVAGRQHRAGDGGRCRHRSRLPHPHRRAGHAARDARVDSTDGSRSVVRAVADGIGAEQAGRDLRRRCSRGHDR